MTDQLTATGLEIDDLQTRIANLKTGVRAACGANLDLSPDQPDGQFVEIFAETAQAIAELIQETYTAFDRYEASADALDASAALTGTTRRAATEGIVTLTLTLDAATTVPAGSIAHVSGEPENRWITDENVTSVGAGDYDVAATAEDTGPIQALAGTITVIGSPVVGWTAVTNAADATEGLALETDTELRLRAEQELSAGGSTSTLAISADMSTLADSLDTSIEVKTYENTDIFTDGDGRPGKSIEVVFRGTDPPLTDAVVAEQIYASKAAGIRAWGSTLTYHVDPDNVSHEIGFTRAVEKPYAVEIVLTKDDTAYPGDGTLKDALVAWSDANLSIDDDVIISQIIAQCFEVAGVVDVTVEIGFVPDPVGSVNLVVNFREIATLVDTDITIT